MSISLHAEMVKHHFLLISEDTSTVAPSSLSLFASLLGSLSLAFLSLPKPAFPFSSPTSSFPPCRCLGSFPTFSFHLRPAHLFTSYLISFSLLYLPLFQSLTSLPICLLLFHSSSLSFALLSRLPAATADEISLHRSSLPCLPSCLPPSLPGSLPFSLHAFIPLAPQGFVLP